MKKPLRLLLVDDNPDDRSLATRELRKEIKDLEMEIATNQRSFEQALTGPAFDIVVTDYQLCWSDGLSVLRAVKGRWPECPVVMFTGTGSEQIAVEGMKAGLDDYVLKSAPHAARLPSAVKAAVGLARQNTALREAETRYATLFDTVPVGLYRMTPTGQIMDANKALLDLLGYDNKAAFLRIGAARLFLEPDGFHLFREAMEREGSVAHFEARLRCADGRDSWVEHHASAIRDPATRLVLYEGSVEDISERKQAEGEREKLIAGLQEAMSRVKALRGLLPICASCKKIRDQNGAWSQFESYIRAHSEADFTHSFCPECARKLYPEVFERESRFK